MYIADAVNFGWSSITLPANGYQTLYSRLIAVSLTICPLQYAELIFHVGAAAALAFTLLVLWLCLPIDSRLGRGVACIAFVWVPSDTLEIFFTLVNTNWPLGVALAILVTSPNVTEGRYRWAWLPAILVLTLSGPVSILLAPIVLARLLVFRDGRQGGPFYAAYGLGTGLQLHTTLTNSLPRLGAATDTSMADWSQGLFTRTLLGFFSGPILLGLTAALFAWFLYSDVRALSVRTRFQIAALPVAGALCLAAGFYAVRDIPALVGPYALHVRYFVIPFGLALFFILAIGRGRMRYAGIALVFLICAAGYRPYYHDDFGSPDDQMAGGASRAPTYLGVYLQAAQYLPSIKFFGRPGQEDFTLTLPRPTPKQPPVQIEVSTDAVRDGQVDIPADCDPYRNLALAMDYQADKDALIEFNTANRSTWYAQFHALAPGTGETVFAVPIRHSPWIELTLANVGMQSARLLCF